MTGFNFRRATRLSDVPVGLPHSVRMPDGEMLCFVREGESVYAMVDRCPHRDFPLSGGDLVAPCILECPWHGAQFDCKTGQVLQGPATDDLQMYAVRVTDGDVFVGPRKLKTI
ncbi:MAG: Rieske (2Fe-2S) protein [Gemmatimonadaceae bacterium]